MSDNSKLRKAIKNSLHNSLISNIITTTAKEYMKENSCSLWDINNGMCDSFAQDVIDKMGGYSDDLFELGGDNFFNFRDPDFAKEHWGNIIETPFGVWSKDMLKRYGVPPIDITKLNDEINHVWIYYKGKHYDAELPNGSIYWWDLPLIKKLFSKFK